MGRLSAWLAAVLIFLGGAAWAQTPPDTLDPVQTEAFVDGVMRQGMADQHIAGAVVTIVQHGRVILKKGYGYADLARGRPVDPDRTLFRIGSISKTFTWILLMREVEAGRIQLDAPVNRYLPADLRIPDEGFKRPIRVEDLMNHTPGFEDRALGQLFERDPRRVRRLDDYLRQERPARVREPGSLVSYSNYGAALAGEIVAHGRNAYFEDLVEQSILNPLGMSHTTFREPRPPHWGEGAMSAELAADFATGYNWTPAGYQARPFEWIGQIAPAGAGSSTGADMGRYMLALLGGGALDGQRIYGPVTAQAFATPQPVAVAGAPGFRHGMISYSLPGGRQGFGHGGATSHFLSNMVLIPDLDLGIFVSTNTDTGRPLGLALPVALVEHAYGPVEHRSGDKRLLSVRSLYEGAWINDRRAYHGLEGFVDRVLNSTEIRVTPDGRLLIAGGGASRLLTPEGDPAAGRFRADNDDLTAFRVRNGRADLAIISLGTAALEREPVWERPGLLALASALAAIFSLWTLRDGWRRLRRTPRQTDRQLLASRLRLTCAFLYLLAFAALTVWLLGAGDEEAMLYNWPGPALIMASVCALLASLFSAGAVALLPWVWRGGRRMQSWGLDRKIGYSLTVSVFALYGVLLAFWGALEPWSR